MSKVRLNHVTINCALLSMDWRIEVNKRKIKDIRSQKSITILGRKYKIVNKDNMSVDGVIIGGCCDPDKRVIYMNNSLNDIEYLNVMCHEICHSIFFTFGGDQTLSDMEIEIFCQSFGSGFSDFIMGAFLGK